MTCPGTATSIAVAAGEEGGAYLWQHFKIQGRSIFFLGRPLEGDSLVVSGPLRGGPKRFLGATDDLTAGRHRLKTGVCGCGYGPLIFNWLLMHSSIKQSKLI